MWSEPCTSLMVILVKIVNNINLKMLTILAKRLILITWLGLGRIYADRYITVLKIQMESTIKTTIKSICPLRLLRIFVRKSICKLLSKHLWQILFLGKFYAFSILFWTPSDGCVWSMKNILWGASYFRHLNNNQTTKATLQKFLMETHLKWKLQVLLRW